MRVSNRRRMLGLTTVLLSSVVWLGGCANPGETTETQKYRPGFASLPASCAEAVKPLETAVKAFAGELYRPNVEFERDVRTDSPSGQAQTLNCSDMVYSVPIPREPIQPGLVPMSRSFSIRYDLTKTPRRVEQITQSLVARANKASYGTQPSTAPGIGEDAITWVDEPRNSPVRFGLRFVIGNLDVDIMTSGWDWSEDSEPWPADDSPKLREDLRAGAESIAKAVAQHAQSALPITVFTPVPSATTSTPPTTTSPTTAASDPRTPAWNPCTIPDSDIAAAGLQIGSKESRSYDLNTRCTWQGAWFRVEIYSAGYSFESMIYSNDDYMRPIRLTIGDRRAVGVHLRFGGKLHCTIAFDVAQNPKSGIAGGTLVFDARVFGNKVVTDSQHTELCDELTRVTSALLAVLPPGA